MQVKDLLRGGSDQGLPALGVSLGGSLRIFCPPIRVNGLKYLKSFLSKFKTQYTYSVYFSAEIVSMLAACNYVAELVMKS